jgi:DNA topoisomerase VI subunit A
MTSETLKFMTSAKRVVICEKYSCMYKFLKVHGSDFLNAVFVSSNGQSRYNMHLFVQQLVTQNSMSVYVLTDGDASGKNID